MNRWKESMPHLDPEILLKAYRMGLFPMAPSRESREIRWFDPELRGILPLEGFHVPQRLARVYRQGKYAITVDRDFRDVMESCAAARPETWINDEIIEVYTALHEQGNAHSI